MSLRAWTIAGLVALAMLPLGCGRRGRVRVGARQERQLRQIAVQELRCSEDDLAITALSQRVYQVVGCNQLREYALGPRRRWYVIAPVYARATTELGCPLEQLQIQAPTPTTRFAIGCGRGGRYDLICQVHACGWVLTATQQPQVAIASSAPTVPSPVVATPSDPSVVAAPASTPMITPGAQGNGVAVVRATASVSPDDLAIPEPPAAGSPEERLRAAFDARRVQIHACVGTGPIPIRASWTSAGEVTLALEEPLAGTQGEQCVREAMGSQQVPAQSEGALMHVVL